jgi:hypothetical protein
MLFRRDALMLKAEETVFHSVVATNFACQNTNVIYFNRVACHFEPSTPQYKVQFFFA